MLVARTIFSEQDLSISSLPLPFVSAKYYFIINVKLKCPEDQVGKGDQKVLGVRYDIRFSIRSTHAHEDPWL